MKKDISLYIHVPFCKKKCAYCDFFSRPEYSENLIDNYIQSLLNEIQYYINFYSINSWKTVYLGGGTPSLLSNKQFETLFEGVFKNAKPLPNAEITVELNPDDVNTALIDCLSSVGVNRISVGIQSLDDKALQVVNRRCTRKTSLEALSLLNTKWHGRFSADLISGLPTVNNQTFEESINTLISYNPDHISMYALTLEEKTSLGSKILSGQMSYDYDFADSQWIFGRDLLDKNGYQQYEVSNFAKPGFESRHNKTYWHLEDYIGVGAGASGTVYNLGDESGIRWSNVENIHEYISFWNNKECLKDGQKTARTVEFLDIDTKSFEFLMMGFRLCEGVSSVEYKQRFGKNLASVIGADKKNGLFSLWEKENKAVRLLKDNDEVFALTKDGMLFLNQFLESLL